MKFPYTEPNRLADVLSLIQFLALDKDCHRTPQVINKIIQPKSVDSWIKIAEEHPEFFHITHGQKDKAISLVARHYEKSYPPIKLEYIDKLMQVAIEIYNIQLKQSRWWTHFVPMLTAVLGIILGILLTR